eukprot:UN00914
MTSTNVPHPTEAFLLSKEERPIIYHKDNRREFSGTLVLVKEDHTLGNTIKSVLLRDQRVLFAGYRMPHPLQHECLVQIQTTSETEPLQVTLDALEDLGDETAHLIAQVEPYKDGRIM